MEERNEVVEWLVKRWLNYYSELKFWTNVEQEVETADRMCLKYNDLLTELTHIIARVLQKGYAETYKILCNIFYKIKSLNSAQQKLSI